jgi:hypothetical protein
MYPEHFNFEVICDTDEEDADDDDDGVVITTTSASSSSASLSSTKGGKKATKKAPPGPAPFAWAHLYVNDELLAGEGKGCVFKFLRSPSLYIVVIPGLDIVEALASAYDALDDGDFSGSGGGPDVRARDLKMVVLALDWLEEKWPESFKEQTGVRQQRITDTRVERVPGSSPQIVAIFRFLGDGQRKAGAFGKVRSALENRETARQLGRPIPLLCLDKGRDELSEAAAKYIDRQTVWLCELLIAVASLKFGYQVVSTAKDDKEDFVGQWVTSLMHEMYRSALLTEDLA